MASEDQQVASGRPVLGVGTAIGPCVVSAGASGALVGRASAAFSVTSPAPLIPLPLPLSVSPFSSSYPTHRRPPTASLRCFWESCGPDFPPPLVYHRPIVSLLSRAVPFLF